MAFDQNGGRLGRGKGHYDRFLSQPNMKAAVKLGVAYHCQIIEEVPREQHDIGLDWLCTEKACWEVGQ